MTLRTSIRGLRARRLLRLGWSQETSSEHPRRIHSTAMLTAAEDKAKAKTDTYKLLIVGGGSAGTAVASKFAQKLDKHFIGIIEPSQTHYYQPMFTLVGSGQRHISQTHRPTGSVLPDNCDWLQTSVSGFSPADNTVSTADGRLINYEYLVLALGMETNYQLVKGLPEALEHDPAVCSNYHPKYAQKTFPAMQAFKEGNAIFTYPNTLIKCGGAAQKILYMTEEYFRKTGKRDKATMIYNTSLGVVFPVPKYSKALYAQILQRNIQLNLMRNLVEVRHETKEAVFEVLGSDGVLETYKYDMLHVAPPCSAPSVLWDSKLSDKTGFVEVDKGTCQHVRFANIFALGDCSNLPTSKTAAAISSQYHILSMNLAEVMAGRSPSHKYDGYTACPLVTKKGLCILAEFGYGGKDLETFPFDQSVPRLGAYVMKVYVMPLLYWHLFITGYWNGPTLLRKIFHLWMKD